MPAAFKPLIDGNVSEWTFLYGIDTPGNFVPGYALYGTADALLPKSATHRVDIVYSDTSANHYSSRSACSDLFMAAQNQARMAGISHDVIEESQLTNINNLIGYDALIFPAMANVDTAQFPAIMSTLPGNSCANMETREVPR